ncbi:MAG: peptidoglycan-associated lipoprotein Pal [Pseudomonadota bacterium]|nr:peptidoglycan-associated lipoprotein Pal [Pseudomonadota bacterium]
MNRFKWLLTGSLIFFMTGCTLYGYPPTSGGASSSMSGVSDSDSSTYGMDMDSDASMDSMADDSLSQELDTIIYFDFDRSELRLEYDDLVSAHAARLNANTLLTVRLEGHADERGSREYNIGLGERRAQTVRRMLLLNGVSPAQITTVSYGEERPFAYGSDEESYQQNRRVEINTVN